MFSGYRMSQVQVLSQFHRSGMESKQTLCQVPISNLHVNDLPASLKDVIFFLMPYTGSLLWGLFFLLVTFFERCELKLLIQHVQQAQASTVHDQAGPQKCLNCKVRSTRLVWGLGVGPAIFWDKVWPYIPSWLWTGNHSPASASWVLILQMWVATWLLTFDSLEACDVTLKYPSINVKVRHSNPQAWDTEMHLDRWPLSS